MRAEGLDDRTAKARQSFWPMSSFRVFSLLFFCADKGPDQLKANTPVRRMLRTLALKHGPEIQITTKHCPSQPITEVVLRLSWP